MDVDRETFGLDVGSYIGFHLAVLGLVSWVTGQPFLIPSLGPSVFLLATLPDSRMNYPGRIIGGECIGALSGYAAFHLLVGSVGATPPLSFEAFRQVLSAFTATVLTTVGTYATNTQHPPAYATTLIVSLGILTRPPQILIFGVALLAMVAVHEGVGKRLPIWNLPYENRGNI